MPEPAPQLRLRVPCKVNLCLQVLGKRPDGYHEIRTVMQAVSLCDELGFAAREDGQVCLTCSDPALPTDERNLVVRAARLLQSRTGADKGADIRLAKNVPTGGGLGGGSADAAMALLALSELWRLDMPREELSALAAELGSDVAFFLQGGTALCEGRGERVSPVACGGEFHYVLVLPGLHVSTAGVYHAVITGLTSREDASTKVREALRSGRADLLGRSLVNDLQAPALSLHAGLRHLWTRLSELSGTCEFEGALLSGSGASFFGVARREQDAVRAAGVLQAALGVPCVAVRSLPAWDYQCSVLTIGRALR